jgi:hypothetical protein
VRLSDRVESKIVKAIHDHATPVDQSEPPDHEFFIVNMPGKGMRAMVALILPVSAEDNTSQMDDIDPYASQGEFDMLISRLLITARQVQSGIVLLGQPGLGRSTPASAGGLVLPS